MKLNDEFDEELEKIKTKCKTNVQIAIEYLDEAVTLAIQSNRIILYHDLENLRNELANLEFTDNGWQKSMSYDC